MSKILCVRIDSMKSSSTRIESLKRQLFDERVCDDLCEEILQYLSLEDKLKLEGVSKQFQRSIFKKQYELNVNNMAFDDHDQSSAHDYCFDLKSIESVLKKCPNIRSIILKQNSSNYNEMIQLITKYCNNLVEIKAKEKLDYFDDRIVRNVMNDTVFEEFQTKFRSKLKCFNVCEKLFRINSFPNIEELVLTEKMSDNEEIIPDMHLNKLKSFHIEIPMDHDYSDQEEEEEEQEDQDYSLKEYLFKKWMEKFPRIKRLNVVFNFQEDWVGLPFDANGNPFKDLPALPNLVELTFTSNEGVNGRLFTEFLKNMKFPKLRSICTSFDIDANNVLHNSIKSQTIQLLSPLKSLSLTRMELAFWYRTLGVGVNCTEIDFPFEMFKDFPNLTHLSLSFHYRHNWIRTHILKDIDIYLPKLKYLKFKNYFRTDQKGVDQMVDILSRLSKLETIDLSVSNEGLVSYFKQKIGEKCKNIQMIKIKSMSQLS